MIKYIIEGRKWFDKINGNTYHAITIHDDKGVIIYNSPSMCYGYGDEWKHTAYKELIGLGLVKKEDRFNHALNSKRFFYTCKDVLKRDLIEVQK